MSWEGFCPLPCHGVVVGYLVVLREHIAAAGDGGVCPEADLVIKLNASCGESSTVDPFIKWPNGEIARPSFNVEKCDHVRVAREVTLMSVDGFVLRQQANACWFVDGAVSKEPVEYFVGTNIIFHISF